MSHYYRDPHPHTGAIRAQVNSLIHRHAHAKFHATLTIHQLSSVPFLTGEFATKWKFRGVVAPPKPSRTRSNEPYPVQYIAKKPLTASPTQSTTSLPAVILSSATESKSGSTGSSSSTSSYNSTSLDSTATRDDTIMPAAKLAEDKRDVSYTTDSRGQTAFVKLREHKIDWEETIDVMLQMGVEPPKESPPKSPAPPVTAKGKAPEKPRAGKLLPCPLKLVITQKITPGDPDAPSDPRLGAVYLDLAEYAEPSLGPVTRKYLLRESKTNAILKLTIHLRPVSTPPGGFIAPHLQVASIQSSLTNLLSAHHHHSRHGHHRYSPNSSRHHLHHKGSRASYINRAGSNLPTNARTEDIIEALFNPFPTASTTPSPFTYHSPNVIAPTPTSSRPHPQHRVTSPDGPNQLNHVHGHAHGHGRSVRHKSSLRREMEADNEDSETSATDNTPSISSHGHGYGGSSRSMTEYSSETGHTTLYPDRDRLRPHHTSNTRKSSCDSSSEASSLSTNTNTAHSEHSKVDVGKERGWWKRFGGGGNGSNSRPTTPADSIRSKRSITTQ
ncbi:hypothetical protein SISNIDRAFT_482751 [Sistotremastrum niveocremeum HHB9708]|uniref:C2 NT-type domain-containing protein n=1 Tax=Sistotremastrum niveocremeum HHB9708 TaxID=1314777 RepID=A0A164YJZ8_9AGAM|nr:hypothetical protein SISNIDRAFT_482751 [Sistotremastrum niveocremeum HHB9708]